jgi:hypothetical protein
VEKYIQLGRPQMAMWHMHFACWMLKATYKQTHIHTHTHTHKEYAIFLAFPLQQWLHKRTSMVRYTYISCLAELTMAFFFFF